MRLTRCSIENTVFIDSRPGVTYRSGRSSLDRATNHVLAHNVTSRSEVEQEMAAATNAGGRVTKEPAETFYGGYAGVFRDPDGHTWEIAHNPGLPLGGDGSLTLPDFDYSTLPGPR